MEEKHYCPETGKVSYTEKAAMQTLSFIKKSKSKRRMKIIPKRCYKCQFCGMYHLTHYNKSQTCKSTLRRYGAK